MSNPNKSVFWGESYILNQNNFRSCLKIQEPKLKVPQRLWSSSKYLGDRDREPWRFVDSFPSIPVIGEVFLGPPGHLNIRGLAVWPALHSFKCHY